MKHSKFGIILMVLFFLITLVPGIYLQFNYGDKQWMWSFIFGGMPWSTYGFGIGFFASNLPMSILGFVLIFLAYLFNAFLLYMIGYGLEKLYHTFRH